MTEYKLITSPLAFERALKELVEHYNRGKGDIKPDDNMLLDLEVKHTANGVRYLTLTNLEKLAKDDPKSEPN